MLQRLISFQNAVASRFFFFKNNFLCVLHCNIWNGDGITPVCVSLFCSWFAFSLDSVSHKMNVTFIQLVPRVRLVLHSISNTIYGQLQINIVFISTCTDCCYSDCDCVLLNVYFIHTLMKYTRRYAIPYAKAMGCVCVCAYCVYCLF